MSEHGVNLPGFVPLVVGSEIVGDAPHRPIREFGLEVQGSCQFGCAHCYMYQSGNTALRTQYEPLPLPVVQKFAERVMDHTAVYADDPDPERRVQDVFVVLHGGEPLLD